MGNNLVFKSKSGIQRVGQLSGDQNRSPFGKNRWKLSRRDRQDEYEEVLLKLSAVSDSNDILVGFGFLYKDV